MRIAGLIAFWVGLATFWVVTVTMVLAKHRESVSALQVASEKSPVGSKTPNESKPANKPAGVVGSPAVADQHPLSKREEKPIVAPVEADAKKKKELKPETPAKKKDLKPETPAKKKELKPETPAKKKKIKPGKDETKTSSAPASKPRVRTKSKTQGQDAPTEKKPKTPAAKAKQPEDKKTKPPVKDKLAPPRGAEKKTKKERKTKRKSQASGMRTSLVLRVPKNAKVYLEGYKTRSTGSVRKYSTTKLHIGRTVAAYSIRVEVTRGGQTIVKERTIRLQAGQRYELTIDFDDRR